MANDHTHSKLKNVMSPASKENIPTYLRSNKSNFRHDYRVPYIFHENVVIKLNDLLGAPFFLIVLKSGSHQIIT